jgi:very-short-patch-repair endonuclease
MAESVCPDDDVFTRVSTHQSGILTAAQATDMLGRGIMRGHLRAGRWRKICRDVVMTTNGPMNRSQHLWAAMLVAGPEAVLAGVTALTEAGVRGLREGAIQILVPAGRKVSTRLPVMPAEMPPIRVIRTRCLPDDHRQAGSPPRATTARAVVDAAVWAPTADAARTVIAATCQQRRVNPEQVFEVIQMRRRLPRAKFIEQTLTDIAGGAEALSEIHFKRLCQDFEIPVPDFQERRRDASGRIRFLDAYWKRWHLHAEVDGSHHMDVDHWTADMLRLNEVWITGDRVLRFPASLIRSRPEAVAGQLKAALQAAGWRKTPPPPAW